MEKIHSQAYKMHFERFSSSIIKFTGSYLAFAIAILSVVTWVIAGNIFNFSDHWLSMFSATLTVFTFLMVFMIQNSQNKAGLSMQLKLNELIAAMQGASNRLVNVEDLTEEELKVLQKYYQRLNKLSQKEEDLGKSHSVDEATENEFNKLKNNPEFKKE